MTYASCVMAKGRGKEMERTRAERKRVKQGDVFLSPVRSDGRGRGVRVKDKGKEYPLQFLKFLLYPYPNPHTAGIRNLLVEASRM